MYLKTYWLAPPLFFFCLLLQIPHTVWLLPSNHLPPFWLVPPTFHYSRCFILNTVYRSKMACEWHFMSTSRNFKIWNNQKLLLDRMNKLYTLLLECNSVCIIKTYRELCTIILKASTHSLQNGCKILIPKIILKCTRAYCSFTVYKNNLKKHRTHLQAMSMRSQ